MFKFKLKKTDIDQYATFHNVIFYSPSPYVTHLKYILSYNGRETYTILSYPDLIQKRGNVSIREIQEHLTTTDTIFKWIIIPKEEK